MKLVLQMIIFSGLYHVQCPKEPVGRSRKRDRIKGGFDHPKVCDSERKSTNVHIFKHINALTSIRLRTNTLSATTLAINKEN